MAELGDAVIDDSLLKLFGAEEGDNGLAIVAEVVVVVVDVTGDVPGFSSMLRLLKVAVVVVDVSGGPHLKIKI